ncbi:MFS general substrate transporter [Cristinia sonorae]|uniref:MFS general substrate transporter n=1 Tax=Cristinia sonorae TaxID=1940300 RepID=A0A8K0UI19_9AGAR|nr:MFS general substrate transporter [Cristinia sonorae]
MMPPSTWPALLSAPYYKLVQLQRRQQGYRPVSLPPEPTSPSGYNTTSLSPLLTRSAMAKEKTGKRPLSSYIWDTWDKPPEERKFLAKLDSFLLTYAALSYFSKYLDQQNVTNAYVSGMKEDLGLHGNQLNYITTAWTCGYVIGQIPSNLIITRIRPSIWIPLMELIWSSLTMVLASAKNFNTLIAVRFFVGLAESTFYPAIQYVIGSWYKGDELGKRACIFHTASSIGPMVSGFLQAGAYNGLHGKGGLEGWRWLFIIDGVITIPIALLGFLIMPDLPTTTKPSILYTQKQIDIAIKRMESIGRKPPAKFTKKKIIGFFSNWHIWVMVPMYVLFNNGSGPAGSSSMTFWLQSFNKPGHTVYTVAQINTYPFGGYVVAIIMTLIYAWTSDGIGARWPPIVFAALWNMVNSIVLAATPLYTNITRRWIFYYMGGCMSGLSGLILAWTNELTGYDNEKRSFVVACCNTFAYVFQAWLPIVIFPQVEQPRVFKGNVTNAGIDFALVCVAFLALYLQTRDEKRAAALRANDDDQSIVSRDNGSSEPRKSDDVYKGEVGSVTGSTVVEVVEVR